MTLAQDSRAAVLDLDGVLAALGMAAEGAEPRIACTIIRGKDGPRWILPDRSPLAQTLLSEWRPYGRLTRLLWFAAPLAHRLGVLALFPGGARSALPADANLKFLRYAGGEFEAGPLVILVGNSAITRKLLVFFEDRNLDRIVLAKVPLTPQARASIANEARLLEALHGRLHTPHLVCSPQQAGIAMQEYLPGRLGSRRLKPGYVDFLVALVEAGERISLREYGKRLARRTRASSAYAENAAPLSQAFALLESDADLPAALVHGDFAPWNIKELPGGACTLIDWEMARQNGLPLYDLCHFYFMQARLFTPGKLFYLEMLKANGWRTYMSRIGIPASLLKPLAAAFLLETLTRYWDGSETPAEAFCLRQLSKLLELAAPGRT